jgi:hypothetical protein
MMIIYKSIYIYEQLALISLCTDEQMNCNCNCKVRGYPRNLRINKPLFDIIGVHS